jgi:large subunit ribosomal protein L33
MAKPASITVQLVNEENPETGTKYLVKKSTKGTKSGNKLRFRKYDPVLKKHCIFIEKRLPNPKAK